MRSSSAMDMRQDMAVEGQGRRAPPAAWDTRGLISAGGRYGSEESALDYESQIDALGGATPGISVVNASEDGDDDGEYEARMQAQEHDEDIRPDVAQFFFSPVEDNTTDTTSDPDRTRSIFVEDFKEEDDASVYPRTSVADSQGGYLASPWEDGDRTSVWSNGTSLTAGGFLDEEKSGMVRQNFVKRVGQMYGPGGKEREREEIPPVPALPRRF